MDGCRNTLKRRKWKSQWSLIVVSSMVLGREASVRRTGWLEGDTGDKEREQTNWSGVRREVFTGHSQWVSTWFWGQPAAWALTPSMQRSN